MSCVPWATTSTGSATQWSAPVPPRPASKRSIGSDPMWSSSTGTSRTSMAWMSSSVYGPGRAPSFSSPIRETLRGGGGGGGGGGRRHQPQALAEVERVHIEKTLRFHGGNRTRAAKELGISRATLINKIKAYGLDI